MLRLRAGFKFAFLASAGRRKLPLYFWLVHLLRAFVFLFKRPFGAQKIAQP